MELDKDTIYVFTDGSCDNLKSRQGGYAAVLIFNGHKKEITGSAVDTTNNQMELMAIREGLKELKSNKYPVIVYTDSEYCIGCLTEWYKNWNWISKPKQNKELLREIVSLVQNKISEGYDISFQHVRSHTGNYYNEVADTLANEARANP